METEKYSSDILTKEFLKKYINKKVPWGFGDLSYIVYKRTYSRTKDNGEQEEWWETIARCLNGAQKIGAKYTKGEAERLFDHVFNLRCNFAGRFLWQLGTKTVETLGLPSLQNCWATKLSSIEDFCFMFDMLMLGGGVGFSVRREDIYELPKVKGNIKITHQKTKDADFILADSRAGWIELLRKTLESFFETGKGFSYSTILIRGAGEKINGFGGIASGPQPLIDGIENICKVFSTREYKKLRSIDVLDIANIIGSIVVSGNVRRSSQISLGDADDYLFLKAKRWDLGNIPNWRAMSNNTIIADAYDYTSDDLWDGFNGNGEPYGLFNLKLTQKYGRLIDGSMKTSKLYPQTIDNATLTNPCGEISLNDGEACCLSELYLNNIDSLDELIDCAKLLYKTQKAVSGLSSHYLKTENIVQKNRRLGLGITGVCQSLNKLEWLDDCYKELRKFDKSWSKENDWNESIKLTTIKPSGTLSLLAGATPGIHPGFSRYFLRRVRIASNDSLIELCKTHGYKTEYQIKFDGSIDHNTIIVEFPCKFHKDTIIASNMKAVEQLELVKRIQTYWSDNAVSCTVYYKKEELPEIKSWLKENYDNSIKSVSFLLHSDHGFKQSPLEEISEDKYKEIVSVLTPVSGIKVGGSLENLECSTGTCPIK